MAADRAELLRAAREALRDELAGGRFAILPRRRGSPNGRPTASLAAAKAQAQAQPAPEPRTPNPEPESGDVSERIRRFREARAARAAAGASAAKTPAAKTSAAEPGIPARGITSTRDMGVFGTKPLTDPKQPPQERLAELAGLAEQCAQCTLKATRNKMVFGDGPPQADLVFVGEAPGADEDASGIPFVGRAGQLLNKIIAAMGLKRQEVYICNVLKCRPPGNRTPLPGEAAQCWPFLREQLELLRPKVICALGAPAARTLLDTEEPIGRLRGAVHDYHGVPLVATYHPAYLLRSPGEKGKVWEDMKVVLKLLGRPVPKVKGAQ
jgi:DNA polymerase